MNDVVLVTSPEFMKAEEVFRSAEGYPFLAVPSDEDVLAEAVAARGARAVVVGVVPYRGPLYEALGRNGGPGGSILVRFGVGHDSVDKSLARRNGVVVAHTAGVLHQSVAEHTMWLLGSVARTVVFAAGQLKAGRFAGDTGIEVHGKTLGVLGLGAIGRRVAAIAHFGFGMRVLAADSCPVASLERREGTSLERIRATIGLEDYTNDVEAVLRASDVISIHLPANAETKHLLDGGRLSCMKPGAILVNTARGSIVDEAALYDALAAGHLRGAGLDVFETEPYAPASPGKDLRTLANVVLTPHIGSNTIEANQRMGRASVQNVVDFFEGRLDAVQRVDPAA